MTLKMHQIIDFPSFFSKIKNQKLPFKTSYHLSLLATEIEKHSSFYQEKFREIILEYGKRDESGNFIPTEDGQGILLAEETMSEAYEKLAELRALEVQISDTKFSLEDFNGVELTPLEMNAIIPFIQV